MVARVEILREDSHFRVRKGPIITGLRAGHCGPEVGCRVSRWSDIPADLQARVDAGDAAVLDPLARGSTRTSRRRVSEDVLQKVLSTLCRLMSSEPGRSLLMSTAASPDCSRPSRRVTGATSVATDRACGVRSRGRRVVRVRSRAAGPIRDRRAAPSSRTAILASLARLGPIEREASCARPCSARATGAIAAASVRESGGYRDEQRLRELVHRARRKLQARLQGLR